MMPRASGSNRTSLDLISAGSETAIFGWHGETSRSDARRRCDTIRSAIDQSEKALVLVRDPRTLDGAITLLATLNLGHAAMTVEDDHMLPQLLRAFRPDYVLQPDGCQGPPDDGFEPLWERGCPAIWRAPVRSVARPIHPELGLVLRTSGSLGLPKAVRLSYRNLLANAESIAHALCLGPGDRGVTSLPLDFSYGLSILTSHLAAGGGVVLTKHSPITERFWWEVGETRATCVGAVAVTYRLLRGTGWDPREYPALRLMLHSGGPIDPDTVRYYAELMQGSQCRFVRMYGQTEATARITCLDPELLESHPESVGSVIPCGELWIDAGNGTRVPDGETGEIVYRGPNVMMGYATSRDDLSEGDRTGGVVRTGDLGRVRDGLLYVEGRRDRQAKLFGKRVDLGQIEAALSGEFATAAVEARTEDRLVIFAEGDLGEVHAARSRICERLGVPSGCMPIVALRSLPRTDRGKLNRRRLAELANRDRGGI